MSKQVVGLKLGASRLNAACVSVNGSTEVTFLASDLLPSGVHRGRRGARGRGARRGAQGVLQAPQAPAEERPHRAREQPHRRSHHRHRRDRRSEAPRQRRSLPRPGGPSDPDRRGRPRLPDPERGAGRGRRADPARAARRRLPRSRHGVRGGLPPRRPSSLRRRSRGVRAAARADADLLNGARRRPRAERPRRRVHRLRAQRPRRVGRLQLRVHARPRLGRQRAHGRDRTCPRGRGAATRRG